MRSLFAVTGAALLVIAATAGCGSSSSSSNSTSSLSKAQFVKQADAICKKGNQQINKQAKKTFAGFSKKQKPTTQQLSKFTTQVLVPSVQSQLNQIRALGAPSGDESQVKGILDAAQKGIAQAKQNPAQFAKSNGNTPAFKKANQMAKAYGLKVCGQS